MKMQKEELDRLDFIAQKEKHLLSGEHIRSEIARVNSDIESSLTRIEDIDKELSGEISSNRKNIVNQLDEIIYTLKNTSAKVREIFNLKEQAKLNK